MITFIRRSGRRSETALKDQSFVEPKEVGRVSMQCLPCDSLLAESKSWIEHVIIDSCDKCGVVLDSAKRWNNSQKPIRPSGSSHSGVLRNESSMDHRAVDPPTRRQLSCKGWHQAALRCLMNNLDPDVAERPDELIVYGGTGKAAATGLTSMRLCVSW